MKIEALYRLKATNAGFMADYVKGTTEGHHEFKEGCRDRGNIQLDVEDQGYVVHIWSIVSLGNKGQGEASNVLDWLCALADKHHTKLQLYPERMSGHQGLPTAALRKWYTKRGFERNAYNYYIRQPKESKMKIEAAARLRTFAGRSTGEGAGMLPYAMDTGRFLLCLRSDDGDDGNTWCGLGGGRDNNEPLDETVRREAWEEAKFPREAKCDLHFIGVKEHDDGFRFTNYLGLVPKEFTPKLNDEHTDYKWVRWEDFPENMHPAMMDVVNSKLARLVMRRNCDVPF